MVNNGLEGVVAATTQLDVAQAVLDDARRTGDPIAIAAAEEAVKNSSDARATAREAEKTLRDDLADAIAKWLDDPASTKTPPDPVSPADDLGRLDAHAPLVLFPVRLETRFEPPGAPTVLKVRVYPDEIFLDTHEKALTAEEQQAGFNFYDGLDLSDDDAHRQRWRDLIAQFGTTRGAYIARVMTPSSDGGGASPSPFGIRSASWTHPGALIRSV